MARWLRRANLGLRAATAFVVQIGVLIASSAINLLFGLLFGLVVYFAVAVVFLPALSERVQPAANDLFLLTIPLVGCVVVLLGLLSVIHGYRTFRTDVFRSAYEPRPMFDDLRVPRSADRLAALAGVPAPEVLYHRTEAPLCMTIRRDGAPALIVSAELPERLTDAELEAIVAHEIAHLANADQRLLRLVIAPLFALGEEDDALEPREALNPFVLFIEVSVGLTRFWGQAAVGLFSRGREYAADRAAAELTGDPASLASALETLSDATAGTPETDLRDHAHAVDATSVYPVITPAENEGAGLRSTHPPTEKRIERLRRLTGDEHSR